MSVTVSSDDNYSITIGANNSGTSSLRVKWGTSAAEVWSLSEGYVMTLTGDLVFKGPPDLNPRRSTDGNILEFADSSGVTAALYCQSDSSGCYYGAWHCADAGLIVKTLGDCPTAGAANGTTRTINKSSSAFYAFLGRVDGTWRKVSLS